MHENASQDLVTGNFYNKYETKNPVARILVQGFMNVLTDMVKAVGAKDVHEIGCGEGFLAPILGGPGIRLRGCDISDECVDQAGLYASKNKIEAAYRSSNIMDLAPPEDSAQLIVCCEVLEHLEDPEKAIDILASLAEPNMICSAPREPIWSAMNIARGRYWTRLGNTPGHLQKWSTKAFIQLVTRRFRIDEVKTPIPWTFLRCRVK